MNPIIISKDIIESSSGKSDACIFMSFGKDSLVTLDLILKYGKFNRIFLCYLCLAKNLEYLNKYREVIRKRYPNIKFIFIEEFHFDYYVYKKDGIFCLPVKTKKYRIKDIEKAINIKYKADCSFFWGWKMCDSPARALTLGTYELQGAYIKANRYYPITRFTHGLIISYMKKYNLPEPIKYGTVGKMNGFGLDKESYKWILKNYPDDLKKIQKEFPYFIF